LICVYYTFKLNNHYNRHQTTNLKKKAKKWGKGINIDSNNVDITDINNFIQFKTLKYKIYDFKDSKLWEVYKKNFQSFTAQIFKNCNQLSIQKLQIFLQTNSVWVKKHKNTTVPKLLFNTL